MIGNYQDFVGIFILKLSNLFAVNFCSQYNILNRKDEKNNICHPGIVWFCVIFVISKSGCEDFEISPNKE